MNRKINLGYSIFAIIPDASSSVTSLPACDADIFARSHPTRNSTSSTSRETVSFFSGTGHSLGGPNDLKGTKRSVHYADDDRVNDDNDNDDDDIEIMEGDVSDESEKRRRRPRFNSTAPSTRELTEDEQFAAAIAASMAGYGETSNGGSSRAEVNVNAGTRSIPRRGDLEEERQLEAALLASMAGADISGEEDDDAPTVDELRKRRLARFG